MVGSGETEARGTRERAQASSRRQAYGFYAFLHICVFCEFSIRHKYDFKTFFNVFFLSKGLLQGSIHPHNIWKQVGAPGCSPATPLLP